MIPEDRKKIYDEVERLREAIDAAFNNWHLEDASVGQARPEIADLIDEIEMVLRPIEAISSDVTGIKRLFVSDGRCFAIWEAPPASQNKIDGGA